jgi:hypothetical protein
MLRKVVGAAVVLVLCVGVALADEIRAVITKVEGKNVTFAEIKGKERGSEKTLPVSATVKVVKGKFNRETKKVESTGDEIEGGLKSRLFTNIPEKGIRATIVTNDDNTKITEIRVLKGKKKKDQ